jgi:hypothetical protein
MSGGADALARPLLLAGVAVPDRAVKPNHQLPHKVAELSFKK